jgi:DNA repair exonuclease SbcCD ATPase subunit
MVTTTTTTTTAAGNNNSGNTNNNNSNSSNNVAQPQQANSSSPSSSVVLSSSVDALLEENAKLRQKLTEMSERNIELQSEMRLTERRMHDQVDEFLIEREQLRNELLTTQQQLKAADERVQTLSSQSQHDKVGNEQAHAVLLSQLAQAQNGLEQSKKLVESLSREMESVGRGREGTTKVIAELETELSEARQQAKTATKKLKALEVQAKQWEQRATLLDRERMELEQERSELRARLTSQQSQQQQQQQQQQPPIVSTTSAILNTSVMSENTLDATTMSNELSNVSQQQQQPQQPPPPQQQNIDDDTATTVVPHERPRSQSLSSQLSQLQKNVEEMRLQKQQLMSELKQSRELSSNEHQVLQKQIDMLQQRLLESEYEQIKKDSLLSAYSGSGKLMRIPSDDLRKAHQKIAALQEHNSFLSSEVARMGRRNEVFDLPFVHHFFLLQ